MTNNEITFNDFLKVEMRVGTIIKAEHFEEARNPSYKVYIDFGKDLGVKKTSAQITVKYSVKELIGKQVIAVVNFPKKQIANFMSECLLLGAVGTNGEVTLLTTLGEAPDGLKIS